jgi:transcriptional regulator with XRE-family HTH domain
MDGTEEAIISQAPRSQKGPEIGARIAAARKEGGMTQEELANRIEVSPRSIQAYEAGEVIPYRYLRRLESVLGKDAAWFLHGDAAPPDPSKQFDQILNELAALRRAVNSMQKQVSALVEQSAKRPRSEQLHRSGDRPKN